MHDHDWEPPGWLLPHQDDAARRLLPALRAFGGALLADAVGLGKSYVALALATRFASVTLVVPAALRAQWRDLAARLGFTPPIVTHEALSRGARIPHTALLVVDEAHRFCSPATRRYDTLARQVRDATVLLVTATPVVNRAGDLPHLLRLFLADHALAALGIPSLEGAAAACDFSALVEGIAPLVVARSSDTARPVTRPPATSDRPTIRAPTIDATALPSLLRAIDELEFPSFGPDAAALLRQHLLFRLASSPEACRESVRRHRTYLDRALRAAEHGERLPRAAARALFGPDDPGQLELALAAVGVAPFAIAHLTSERGVLDRVARLLAEAARCNPKAQACIEILAGRRMEKTLVFTGAVATAHALAGRLGWKEVAVVAARGARIASGPIAAHEAYRLFAPEAQRAAAAPHALRIRILIATDLASEGLNLQDADAVLHYDLPWTPLRLQQRIGRIARLGSVHRRVAVWWFAPAPALEERLGLTRRVADKSATQLALGVPTSSAVGQARMLGGRLDLRERLASGSRASARGHAVVTGPAGALLVVRWKSAHGDVHALLNVGDDANVIDRAARSLEGADSTTGQIPTGIVRAIRAMVRRRAAAAAAGGRNAAGRRLRRRILASARRAAADRDRTLLHLLDTALVRVSAGLSVGAERALSDAFDSCARHSLQAWVGTYPARHPGLCDPEVEAVLVGDGTG